MKQYWSRIAEAFLDWQYQSWLAWDQLLNAVGLGFLAVLMTILTGARQAICYADETLSAHAWRARRKPWGSLAYPAIDILFFWQENDPDVDKFAGRPVPGHCERAYFKELLRKNLPVEYRPGAQ